MKNLNILDYAALGLVIIGGLNWGLVGVLHFDLVAALFGDMSSLTRIVYGLVGIAAVYVLILPMNLARKA